MARGGQEGIYSWRCPRRVPGHQEAVFSSLLSPQSFCWLQTREPRYTSTAPLVQVNLHSGKAQHKAWNCQCQPEPPQRRFSSPVCMLWWSGNTSTRRTRNWSSDRAQEHSACQTSLTPTSHHKIAQVPFTQHAQQESQLWSSLLKKSEPVSTATKEGVSAAAVKNAFWTVQGTLPRTASPSTLQSSLKKLANCHPNTARYFKSPSELELANSTISLLRLKSTAWKNVWMLSLFSCVQNVQKCSH